jgi:hypothetical protein
VLAILEAESRVAAVSILFPDPHFKKQHKKRRVVTPELVSSLAAGIRAREGGPVGDETVYVRAKRALRSRRPTEEAGVLSGGKPREVAHVAHGRSQLIAPFFVLASLVGTWRATSRTCSTR